MPLPVPKIPAKITAPLADTFFADADTHASRARTVPLLGVVLHTTGGGPGVQRIYDRFGQDARADRAYAQRLSSVLSFKGHYLVGTTGQVFQVAPLDRTAHHTGGSAVKALSRMRLEPVPEGAQARFGDTLSLGRNAAGARIKGSWFAARFPRAQGPLDLPPWYAQPDGVRSVNRCTVGVDLLEPRDGIYTDAQISSLVTLLRHLRQDLVLERDAVWTHSELDPYSRTNAKGEPWDLGARFAWADVRAAL